MSQILIPQIAVEEVSKQQEGENGESQLRFAIEAAELATWDFNPITNTFTANHRFTEWFGVPAENSTDNNLSLDVIANEDRQRVIDAYTKVLSSPYETYDIEYRITPPNKPERMLRAKGKAWFDEHGTAYRFTGTLQDVTEQVTAHKRLEETQKELAEMANAMPQLVWMASSDGNVYYYNSRVQEFAGAYQSDDGKWRWEGLIHSDDLKQTTEAWRVAVEAGSVYETEHRIKFKDGSFRWFLSRGLPQFDANGKLLKWFGTATDIHNQKTTAERVSSSEAYFRQLTDTLPAIIWITAPNGACTYLNQQWYQYTGQTKEEAEGFGWLKATHPDDKESAARIFLEANAVPKSFSLLYRLRTKTGDYRWAIDSGRPNYGPNGEFEGMIGTVVDVHEEKMAEEALAKANTHLQISTNAASVGTWSLDVATGLLEWSDLHKRMWGYNPGKPNLTYEDWHAVILPGDKEEAFRNVEEARRNHTQYEAVYRIRRANDGVVRWMRSVGQYVYNGAGEAVTLTGISMDITDQRAADQQFRILAETLPNLVWATDQNGVYDFASNQWIEYTGLDPRDEGAWEQIAHADDMPGVMAAWTASLKSGRPYHAEIRLKNRAGEYRWHVVDGQALRNDDGPIKKWIGAFTDIHDQKTQSEKLQALVAERTKELERSNEDLQQFAHVASHDLKEPIRKVRTFGSRLEDEYGSALPERGKLYLSKMQSAADRMFGLIDGVLEYSTLNAMEKTTEPVDLNTVLQNIELDLEVLLQQKNARLIKRQMPVVNGSPVLLNQLFYNLINNALKFSKPGIDPIVEVQAVVVSGDDVQDVVTTASHQTFAQISVCDNGIGFGQQHAEKIFKTFTRLNSRDAFEGTGLGLSLCKKIAERHSGTVYAQGREGEGACFYVLLPL